MFPSFRGQDSREGNISKVTKHTTEKTATHHSKFIFVQLSIFINVTQIPNLRVKSSPSVQPYRTVFSLRIVACVQIFDVFFTESCTFPRTSRGRLELMRTGLTLSPDSRPLSGDKLSNIPSNLLFSSGCEVKKHLLQ